MFVMMDLTDEVSAGTVESAKEILEKLIRQCNSQNEKVRRKVTRNVTVRKLPK